MDIPTILIRITGFVFLGWTARSIYIHIQKERKIQNEGNQSVSERFLNNVMLYLWLFFSISFSIGMIVNN